MANKDYNKISTKKKSDEPKTTVSKTNKQSATDVDNKSIYTMDTKETVDFIVGFVSNCEKLNIRTTPDKNSEILIVVDKGTKVEVNEKLSNDEFYSIKAYCPNDITIIGYAMKDFITIK